VGGGTHVFGPILGALVLNILSVWLRPVKELEPIIFALILIGAVLLLQRGLLGLVQTSWEKLRAVIARVHTKGGIEPSSVRGKIPAPWRE